MFLARASPCYLSRWLAQWDSNGFLRVFASVFRRGNLRIPRVFLAIPSREVCRHLCKVRRARLYMYACFVRYVPLTSTFVDVHVYSRSRTCHSHVLYMRRNSCFNWTAQYTLVFCCVQPHWSLPGLRVGRSVCLYLARAARVPQVLVCSPWPQRLLGGHQRYEYRKPVQIYS